LAAQLCQLCEREKTRRNRPVNRALCIFANTITLLWPRKFGCSVSGKMLRRYLAVAHFLYFPHFTETLFFHRTLIPSNIQNCASLLTSRILHFSLTELYPHKIIHILFQIACAIHSSQVELHACAQPTGLPHQ
jgi:hypothetical protein